jgi:hypothetical protein
MGSPAAMWDIYHCRRLHQVTILISDHRQGTDIRHINGKPERSHGNGAPNGVYLTHSTPCRAIASIVYKGSSFLFCKAPTDNSNMLPEHLLDGIKRVHEFTKLDDSTVPKPKKLREYDPHNTSASAMLEPRHNVDGSIFILSKQENRVVGQEHEVIVDGFETAQNSAPALLLPKTGKYLDWSITDKIDVLVDAILYNFKIAFCVGRTKIIYALT